MDIEGSINKFLAPVEKYGSWIGAGAALLIPDMQGNSVLNGLTGSINNLLAGQVHAPEVTNIINDLVANDVAPVVAAAVGMALESMGHRTVSQVGAILKKVGIGYAVFFALQSILYYSTHSPAKGNDQGGGVNAGYLTVSQGSTLGSGTGGQRLAQYMSVYPTNPTAGTMYTATSGGRLQGN